ncbi:hypothetical protein DAPPUDRAFT_318723 [Daphnia pulex]|uniref:Exuperantia RNAse H-like domain-containing protein n=1 Tax=Daphnia pulex TaxID=6669 RepID=E9GK49_DAPPU|nr:hypothetical protein DAPPUDRAFT_318723 [Daphnia pulex]|eukprot:EFX80307.1 hypothetical protein DAPPUDRAFT_318723 [Daphnia pulex]
MWEATVTGRRLIDEMVNLRSFYVAQEEKAEGHDFNEYVIPYGKLPLNVIRNYNLRIVDTGRYRMLKEIRNKRMLKSKNDGVVEVIKENINGKNEADVEEVIKLLNQHLAQPDKPVRRGSGRRAPRTRSLCTATDLEKQQPASRSSPRKTTTTLSK